MDSNSSIFNFRRWPWAVLLTLALLAASELVAWHFADRIRSFSDKTILYKKRAVIDARQGPSFDGLIMGDSRVLGVDAGVVARGIAAALGREFTVFNLSLPGSGVQSYYLLLKKYLRYHRPPELIIFSVAPISWTGESNFSHESGPPSTGLHRFCLMFSVADCYEAFPLKGFFRALIAKIERGSFLLTYRRMIRDRLENWDRPYTPEPGFEALTNGRSGGIRYADGGVPGEDAVRAAPEYTMTFTPQAESAQWYAKFLQLAQDNGIRVVLAHAPQIDLLYEHRQANGDNQRYESFLQDFQQKFNRLSVLTPMLTPYDRRFFRDTQHLNGPGFRRFSAELGARAAELLTGQNGTALRAGR